MTGTHVMGREARVSRPEWILRLGLAKLHLLHTASDTGEDSMYTACSLLLRHSH